MSNNTKSQTTTAPNLKLAAQDLDEGKTAKRKTLFKVLAIVVVVLFLLLIIATIFGNRKKRNGGVGVLPEPTRAVSLPVRAKPTHPVYAEDPTILEIEEKVRATDQELIFADLEETKLVPPILDLDINFQQ